MPIVRRRAAAVFAALTLLSLIPGGLLAQAVPGGPERVDALFQRWDSHATPGCAVAAARGGTEVLARAYGMADLEHGVPNHIGTIFEAGSVSKQFTAAAVVLLALDGALSLDDDVRRFIPELPDYGTTITIRHLLNHTSGLRDWGSVAAVSGWGRSERTHSHDHVLDILSRQSALNYTPGEDYSYTNSGYNLLAILVGRVSGQAFADFSRARIFEPLGLADTSWRDDYRRIVPRRASAYAMRGDQLVIDRPIEHVHGNGGLLTTVRDLLRWDHALASGELGGPELVRLMHEQGVLNDGRTISYAAGVQIGARNGLPEVSHTGATSGYRAFLGRYPEQELSVALLCNVGAANPGSLGRDVVDLLLGVTPSPQPTAAQTAASGPGDAYEPSLDDWHRYTGVYHSPDAETTLTIVIHDGQLVALRRPGDRLPLVPDSPDTFRGPGLVRFHRDPAGQVTALSLQQSRVHDLRFERVEPAVR